MNITRDVIQDLLPVYLAGEASADTVALVEEYLRQDGEMARGVEALRANPIPELGSGLPPTQEKETLEMTKRLLHWRGILLGIAVFFSLCPAAFRFDNGRVTWIFLQGSPPMGMVWICLAAAGAWAAYLYVRRRVQGAGV